MNLKRTLFLLAAVLPLQLSAKVTLPAIFTDNMVLQQQSDVKIWGRAKPGKAVKVTTSWDGKTYATTAAASGGWEVRVSTPVAGGPYTVTVSDGKPVELKNVLIGEVWLCSGQSNMEMRVADRVLNYEQEMKEADAYGNIRLLHIDNTTSPVPLDEASVRHGGWQVCSGENIADFSATGYFFGKELYKNLGIPIGLIESCWGGTYAESWTSAEALSEMPYFRPRVEKVKQIPESREARNRMFHDDMDEWRLRMMQADKAFEDGRAVWAESSFDDSSWGEIAVPGFVQDQGLDGFSGFMWVRRDVEIPAGWAGKELTLTLAAIDDNDFTYFNGVEVGHTEGCMAFRSYKIPASLVKAGKATVAVRVMDTGGKGGIFGDANSIALAKSDSEKLPLAGQWKYKVSMGLGDAPDMPVNTATEPNYPTFLFNAMINPLVDYAIRGAIWYQGEANVARAAQYRDLLPLMIHDWRQHWGYAFPFYIVQLPNYMKAQEGPEESEWAELREAQKHALRLENTGLAVCINVGDGDDLHPKNKPAVGRRLSLVARALTYGEQIPYSGPVYEGYRIEGNTIRIDFSHTDKGLKTSDGGPVRGFYIAGPDHKFHAARAVIEGSTVVVSSDGVRFPVGVRYAWANNPVCNLCNGAGLPAGPFRTDDWTDGAKRY